MGSDSNSNIVQRKARHIEVCTQPSDREIQVGKTGFERVRLPHRSLPQLSWDEIRLECLFLNRTVKLPLFISCMTGGSDEGHRANRELAIAAQKAGIAVGLGSHRILFRHPEVFEHFHLRPYAPDVPLLSNIGGVQVRDLHPTQLVEMNKRLEVDAQVIHLNPAQELFQENGDKDFRGIREAIARFVEVSPIPVIVKETGCGLSPEEVLDLVNLGVAYVDVAGHGGTSWIMVEAARGTPEEWEEAQDFADWGWPTADILIHLRGESSLKNKILASGGLRSAMDLAKSLALGASLGGMALPFIQAVVKGGSEAVLQLIQKIEKNLRRIHLLTGCRSPQELSTLPLEIFPAR